MSETAVQTPLCDLCGAEIREGSQFCFNCGGKLPPAIPEAEPKHEQNGSKKKNGRPAATSEGSAVARSKPASKPTPPEKTGRRRQRTLTREPVSIVWEPSTGISIPFLIGSVVFVLLAVALVIAALYVR